jgi:uncharacterized protein (DUF2164 family)
LSKLYVVQTDPYGKFVVNFLDDELGVVTQTISIHDTREEAVARAQYLQNSVAELEPVVEPEHPETPPALRGYP